MTDVLLVEDDMAVREALAQTLELAGLSVMAAGSFVAVKDRINREHDGVVLSDIRMPGRDGMHLLAHARSVDPDLPIVLLTGEGDVPTAVRAMSDGAFAFLEKPCDPDELTRTLRKALDMRRAALEIRRTKADLEGGDAAARLVFGISPQAAALRDAVRAVARGHAPVIVHGEPGVGTPKIAEVVHLLSQRGAGPFVKRAATTLDACGLLEAVDRAKGGSLFLDRVDALAPPAQHALAQVEDADVRLLSATHESLDHLRQILDPDLFYRLDGLRVRIPSLRERPQDIPVLFERYLAQACEQADLAPRPVPPELQARLMAQDWPGNARALMNYAMRYAMGLEEETPQAGGLADRMRAVERAILVETLERHGGHAMAAAEDLKLPRKTFYDKLTRHGLKADDFRRD
ncbi:sigma-54-dependent transcriptional regulator [Jannaschia aquimarina]|uniref:DctD_1 protein n=1 Tax=Jannaschia aquimarina TaxID=935700 RepID=A0A0D1EHY5_9RHOB|nr:sigma-54 dependent transcriptional regulator [Jannaschia aquimarina]KIT17249.1 C4-dicarboxylate transport transcriptional regulatory protein DctD [Jannaschia aquimarina]SNT19089.1 two component, sigma54 specific, transcriptional regulator, Fis family [Jannaschia aquimarina]